MTKKNKIIFAFLGILNFIFTLFLTIFVLPEKVPFLVNTNEIIISQITKWIMLLSCFVPSILAIIILINKDKKVQFFLKIALILAIFENVLFFSYFCLSKNLNINNLHEIPISVSIFMPISVIIVVCSTKLKNCPYLSKPAINFKPTRETEFIWKQTQIFARDAYFLTGIMLFFISIIFCFLRYCLIEFLLFVIAIIISTIVVYKYTKSIFNKYKDMKKRQDAMKNRKVKEN